YDAPRPRNPAGGTEIAKRHAGQDRRRGGGRAGSEDPAGPDRQGNPSRKRARGAPRRHGGGDRPAAERSASGPGARSAARKDRFPERELPAEGGPDRPIP